MGKPKKGKTSNAAVIDSDEEANLDPIAKALKEINEDESVTKTTGKKGKKKKKKDVDELFNEISAVDGENEMPDDNDKPSLEEDTSTKGKKGKKGRKKRDDWDVDDMAKEIEALSIETQAAGTKGKQTLKKQDAEDDEDVEKEVKDATKTNSRPSVHSESDDGDEDKGVEGPVMKTAAQKRAEKKERDKRKKDLQRAEARNKRQKDQEKDPNKEVAQAVQTEVKEESDGEYEERKKSSKKKKKGKEDDKVRESTEVVGSTEGAKPVAEDDDADEEDDDDVEKKKKRKKKKKGKDEEEEKEKKKKPAKAQVRLMQEALKRMKEEEERRKAEAEAAAQALELAEEKRLEKIRLDKERKEREKQKKKERIERLKKEGKFLTKSQKEAKARAEAMLESFKLQGIDVPSKETVTEENRSRVRYGVRDRKKKKDQNTQLDDRPALERENSDEPADTTLELAEDTTTVTETVEQEVIQESWEEVTELWDADEGSEEEEEEDGEEGKEEDPSDVPRAQVTVRGTAEGDNKEDEDNLASSSSSEDEASSSSEEDEDSETESDSEDSEMTPAERVRSRAILRMQKRKEEAEAKRSTDNLRSPVVVVLGHVDTGKTKILDKIRHSHVQDGEAGGITQQIGATMVPPYAIKEQTKMCRQFAKEELKIPGLLIIDTPGHESFSNLRSRGSSLCDIAILVVDVMHGLEPQTIESLNLLRLRKTPFIVALNKIDVLYEWKTSPHTDIVNTIKKQKQHTKNEFEERVKLVITEFAEQGLNAALFHENPDTKSYVSMVPTSAHSGDGMGNLIALLIQFSQTKLAKRLAFSDELQCTTLEVKSLTGLGTAVDVVLVNGRLHEGDTIVLAGQEGPIVTPVRGLLMPQPLKELRVKNQYQQHKEVIGAQGIKIIAKDLEKALAGMPLLVAKHSDEVEILKEEVAELLRDALKSIKMADLGVHVHASTLGSLEALLEFLKTSKIPYSGIAIGPVHRKDVMKASVMLERDSQYAVILAFDTKIERDAQEMADREGIKIFHADIIYHLFDKFMAYREETRLKLREEHKNVAIFPCKLRVIPQYIFNARSPIVVGVMVEGGIVKVGTPICVPSKECINLGAIASVEVNHKNVESARKGQEVCIKIEHVGGDAPKMYGRHFDSQDLLVSRISRESIDAVKKYFREDLEKSDWQTMIELKKLQQIL